MKYKIKTPPAPTLDLRIESPIELRTLSVAIGTIIEDYSGTYQCVANGIQGSPAQADLHGMPPCAGCDASWTLCRIMCCSRFERRDNTDIHLIKLCTHE